MTEVTNVRYNVQPVLSCFVQVPYHKQQIHVDDTIVKDSMNNSALGRHFLLMETQPRVPVFRMIGSVIDHI